MVNCSICDKKLGVSCSRVIDGMRLCPECVEDWCAKRKEGSLIMLHQGGAPVEVFRISPVVTSNPDQHNDKTCLVGFMAFLDKGICFAELVRYDKPEAVWGLFLGVLGSLLDAHNAQKKEKKVLDLLKSRMSEFSEELAVLFEAARQVFFYSREELTGIRTVSSGVEVRMGKKRKKFAIRLPKKQRQQYRPLVEAYANAIRSGTDPILECKGVQMDFANSLSQKAQ